MPSYVVLWRVVLCCSVKSRCNQRLDERPARAIVRGLYRIQREKSRRDPVNVSVLVCKYAKDVAGPMRDSREQSRRGRKPFGAQSGLTVQCFSPPLPPLCFSATPDEEEEQDENALVLHQFVRRGAHRQLDSTLLEPRQSRQSPSRSW